MSSTEASHPIPLTAVDLHQLTLKDEDFHLHTWDDLKEIIANNRLEDLKRKPSDLRRYVAWLADTKRQYGTITSYLCQERLRWEPVEDEDGPTSAPKFSYRNPTPFANPKDYLICLNDWPYGFVPSITHICVWLKTPLAVDDATGDLTPSARQLVNDFVNNTFVRRLDEGDGTAGETANADSNANGYGDSMSRSQAEEKGQDEKQGRIRSRRKEAEPENRETGKEHGAANNRVLWFKNWVALQSVRGIDHVHVLVRDAPQHIIDEWIN